MRSFKISVLILVALIVLPPQLSALTLDDITTQVRRNVRDTGESGRQRYSDAYMMDLANEADKDIVNQTWPIERETSQDLTANTTYYDLPSNFIAMKNVYYTSPRATVVELPETSYSRVMQSNPSWWRQAGTPVEYFIYDVGTPLRIGINQPPGSSSTGTVSYRYYAMANEMDSGSVEPLNGRYNLVPYQPLVVDYMTARIMIIEGKSDQGSIYFNLYTNGIATMKTSLGKRPNFNPSFTGGNATSPPPGNSGR